MQYLREGWGQDIAVLPKRGEYRQFADLEGLGEKEGVMFLREGWYSNPPYV